MHPWHALISHLAELRAWIDDVIGCVNMRNFVDARTKVKIHRIMRNVMRLQAQEMCLGFKDCIGHISWRLIYEDKAVQMGWKHKLNMCQS